MTRAESIEAVRERERERELHFSNKSTVRFNICITHTSNLKEIRKGIITPLFVMADYFI